MANRTAYQNMFVITTFHYSSVENNEHDCNILKKCFKLLNEKNPANENEL